MDFMGTLFSIRNNQFNPVLYGGKLFQQFILDVWNQILSNNIYWNKYNQDKLRSVQAN